LAASACFSARRPGAFCTAIIKSERIKRCSASARENPSPSADFHPDLLGPVDGHADRTPADADAVCYARPEHGRPTSTSSQEAV
jgi:hypothetical protein